MLVIISSSSFPPTFMKLSLNSQDLIAFKLCANLANIDSHCILTIFRKQWATVSLGAFGKSPEWWEYGPRTAQDKWMQGHWQWWKWWRCCKLWWRWWVTRAWILHMYNVHGPFCRIDGYKVTIIIYLRCRCRCWRKFVFNWDACCVKRMSVTWDSKEYKRTTLA